MSAPTFIQEVETNWTRTASPGTTKTTSSFSVLAGDILVAYAMSEDQGNDVTGISGGSLTWTSVQRNTLASNVGQGIWVATVDADKSMTVIVTKGTSNTSSFGVGVLTFRDSDGIGASAKINSTGAPSLNLTTTQANSAIVVVNGDWNALSGARTWRTTAGTFSEQTYDLITGAATYYGGYYPDVDTAGAKTVGLTAPTGQKYSIMAVEVLGSTPSGGSTAPSVTTGAVTDVDITTATGNGSVDDDGGDTITARGVCWSTSPNPTTADNTATAAGTTGSFSVAITGLTNHTLYHVRAYATNSIGTSYGSDVTFQYSSATLSWISA